MSTCEPLLDDEEDNAWMRCFDYPRDPRVWITHGLKEARWNKLTQEWEFLVMWQGFAQEDQHTWTPESFFQSHWYPHTRLALKTRASHMLWPEKYTQRPLPQKTAFNNILVQIAASYNSEDRRVLILDSPSLFTSRLLSEAGLGRHEILVPNCGDGVWRMMGVKVNPYSTVLPMSLGELYRAFPQQRYCLQWLDFCGGYVTRYSDQASTPQEDLQEALAHVEGPQGFIAITVSRRNSAVPVSWAMLRKDLRATQYAVQLTCVLDETYGQMHVFLIQVNVL